MTDLNIFFTEWKTFTHHQKEILERLEAYNEDINSKLNRRVIWLSGGLAIAILIIGIVLGSYLSFVGKNESVAWAVSTKKGCKALGGELGTYTGSNKPYCLFDVKAD